LCRRVKTDPELNQIAVILLTGLSDPLEIIKGIQCGAENFIVKPYEESYLVSCIQDALANQERRRQGIRENCLELSIDGQTCDLTYHRMQIVSLLISAFRDTVENNLHLQQANHRNTEALNQIKALQADYRLLLESNPDGIVVVDRNGIILYANPATEELFGRSVENLTGAQSRLLGLTEGATEVNIQRGGEEAVIAEMLMAESIWEKTDVRILFLRDISKRKQLENELRDLSETDEQTGLYNRRGFLTMALRDIKLAKRVSSEVALFYMDLDGLKIINDTLGHLEGDRAIEEVAGILRGTFRDADVLSRIGGDEFAALCFCSAGIESKMILERLRENIHRHNQEASRPYQISLSIGMSVLPLREATGDDHAFLLGLLAEADRLMYVEKVARRGTDSGE
jgi:diguanylate cyclase (GGDEF)-like protein